MSKIYPRMVESYIANALKDTRVVMITGPRQSGKTTLAKRLIQDNSGGGEGVFLSLDDSTIQDAAREDPRGFLRQSYPIIIDEIQRVPELLLAIKENVDNDPTPGRFLITGSANIMTLPRVADSLAGRMETINLFPFAQTELRESNNTFLQDIFSGKPPASKVSVIGEDLVKVVLAGGYPEALKRSAERRYAWHNAYINDIINRDIKDIANIENLSQIPTLLSVLTEYAGQQINYTEIGRRLELSSATVKKYTSFLQQLYLLKNVNPWFSNKLNRLIRTPKLHFFDSGLLASLRKESIRTIKEDRTSFGALLESFIFSEILKLSTVTPYDYEIFYFRDRDNNEVDVVIEDRTGQVVGIEIKAAATVRRNDFNGLRKLAEARGKKFIAGLVLYDDDMVVPFGSRMWAAPISALF